VKNIYPLWRIATQISAWLASDSGQTVTDRNVQIKRCWVVFPSGGFPPTSMQSSFTITADVSTSGSSKLSHACDVPAGTRGAWSGGYTSISHRDGPFAANVAHETSLIIFFEFKCKSGNIWSVKTPGRFLQFWAS